MRSARGTLVAFGAAGLIGVLGCGSSSETPSTADTQTPSLATTTAKPAQPKAVEFFGASLTTATAGKPGAVVQSVDPNTQSRLRAGDVIVAYNGKPVTGAQDLVDTAGAIELGGRFKITVVRGSQRFDLHEIKAATTFLGVEVKDGGARGAAVVGIAPDSPAAKVGLRKGDLITSVDGAAVKESADLLEAVGTHSPGDSVEIGALRDAKELKVTAVLVRRPAP